MYMNACYTKSDKISAYGIRGLILLWIKDFHTGRRQYVSIKGETSSWKDVFSGVPQGSVLNPMLFVTYINDLPEVVPSVVKIFADDTKLCNTDINNDITVFTKVLKTLQDIRSGKLTVFTRPETSLPDRKKIYNNNAESEFRLSVHSFYCKTAIYSDI